VIDHLYRDSPVLRFLKRTRRITVQSGPGFFVDLGLKRGLQRAVRVIGAKEVGVADEETFFVVVGVDEPAGDAVGTSLMTSPVWGLKTSAPFTLTRSFPSFSVMSSMSGSPKMTKMTAVTSLRCQFGTSSLIWIFFFSNLARGAPCSSYRFSDHSLLFFTSGEQKA
jgi:hypothetical protein